MTEEAFYEDGLRFGCKRCGECCRQKSGYLFLTASDLRRLAEALEMSDEEFFTEYCEVVDLGLERRVSLIEAEDGGCVFFGGDGCQLYAQRPLQCRTFPFWATNLTSLKAWEEGTALCAGASRGRLRSADEIERQLARREEEPLLGDG